MRFLLCLLLLLPLSAAAEEVGAVPSGAIILDMRVKVELGQKTMAASPKIAIKDGATGEIAIENDNESVLKVKVKATRLDGQRYRMELKLVSEAGGQKLSREMKFETLEGAPAKFEEFDKETGNGFALSLRATTAP